MQDAWPGSLMPSSVDTRVPEESQPPSNQVKPLFRHFRRIDSCLQTRVAFRGSDESECSGGSEGSPDRGCPLWGFLLSQNQSFSQHLFWRPTHFRLQWGGEQRCSAGGCADAAILPTGEKPPSRLCLVFCRVYMPDHSYVTIRSRLSASVQDILGSVTEKLQYSEEPAGREDSLILVAVASSGGEGQKELGWGGGVVGEEEKLTSPMPWGTSNS